MDDCIHPGIHARSSIAKEGKLFGGGVGKVLTGFAFLFEFLNEESDGINMTSSACLEQGSEMLIGFNFDIDTRLCYCERGRVNVSVNVGVWLRVFGVEGLTWTNSFMSSTLPA